MTYYILRIEPLLYRVLKITYLGDPLLSIVESKAATFIRNAVRHVYLRHSISMKDANEHLLLICSETVNLFMDRGLDLDLLPVLDKMRLRKLDLTAPQEASEWAQSILSRPLFLSITHLSFYQEKIEMERPKPSDWHDWSQLASLPALTHLALSEELSRDILSQAVVECPGLVLAVTLFWTVDERADATAFAKSLATADPRVVVMVMESNIIEDWKIGARGSDDFWVRADMFVARKRKGEIQSPYLALYYPCLRRS